MDERYFTLAKTMVETAGAAAGRSRVVFGTHDADLIARIRQHARATGVGADVCEFHMLHGIQRHEQLRLVKDGASVRVLIAYGSYWFRGTRGGWPNVQRTSGSW